MKRKRSKAAFVAVLPASVLLSCASPGKTSNPPLPPVTYGPRIQEGDACTVFISGNPPQQRPVSCTAPIEKIPGYSGCQVESAEDPKIKIGVDCNSPPIQPPTANPPPGPT